MGLKQTTISAVKAAMKAVGDLKTPVVYSRVIPGAYDPDTDTTNDTVTTYTFEAVRVGLAETEQAWIAVDKVGAKLLIAYADLPIEPLITDYVTIEGARWEVVNKKRVPGDSLWSLIIQGT